MDYIQRLENAMELSGEYEPEYIEVCLNYAKKLVASNLPVLFDRKHVWQVLKMHGIKFPCYHVFYVKGKRKYRKIEAPSLRLKGRQKWILEEILNKIPVSPYCHGFVKEKSIVTNARMHIGKEQSLVMDIQDFFPSIKEEQVEKIFRNIGYSVSASKQLAQICCSGGRLPQGSPSSPCMANLCCIGMDEELGELAQRHNLVYTRYADDLTFSGDIDLEFLIPIVEKILQNHGFSSNTGKTRIDTNKRMVTGVLIDEKGLRVPKFFKRKLKQEIYYCKKFGVYTHLKNTGNVGRVNFREYLYGKAYYIQMVEPGTGRKFLEELDSIQW